MSYSLNFNAVDLSGYGLVVTHSNLPDFRQDHDSQLIQNTSYGFKSKRPPKIINLDVIVSGATRAILDGYLDSIKSAIVHDTDKVLKIDIVTDRYWNARNIGFDGGYRAAGIWQGNITFQADDPMAYDNTETSSDFNIDSDPDTVIETVGGNGFINPVYTLTAGEDLSDVDIKVENIYTGEEMIWEGSLSNGEELEIDVAAWVVKKEGTEDMDISGIFPRLVGGINNSIKVTGFSTTGSLNIKYRARYL